MSYCISPFTQPISDPVLGPNDEMIPAAEGQSINFIQALVLPPKWPHVSG